MIENNKEIWKDIPNYEGYYQASDMGRVRSVDRKIVDSRGGIRFYKSAIIKGSVSKGYRQVKLSIGGKTRIYRLSQLIAIAFLNHIPNGFTLVVDHINGKKLDDRVDNLRIVTNRDNSSNCFRSDKGLLTSTYVGVCRKNGSNRWISQITYKNIIVYLGSFEKEIDASKAYQAALSKINNGTFNPNDYKYKGTSKKKGVSFNKKKCKWVAQITVNRKRKYLGLFNTEIEAHNAYQKALTNQL